MTPDPAATPPSDGHPGRRPRSLRGRLLAAFVGVAVAAVALVTAAALVGTSAGLSAQQQAGRDDVVRRAAAAAGDAYRRAGGWDGAQLTDTVTIATGAGARLVVRDASGTAVLSTAGMGRMNGMGNGQGPGGQGPGAHGVAAVQPVTVDRATVGSVTLVFPNDGAAAGRPVAWRWIGAAAISALALALTAAWLITRSLTRPLAVLTSTARAFAAGDRQARARLRADGETPDELGTLAAAFDDAAERVQRSEQARRHLAADVAHELRTPLAALQAGLEELRDGLAPADTAALGRLHDQSLRLGRAVSDLADLSAADAAALTLRREPADLSRIARTAVEASEARLRAAGLVVVSHLDEPVPVHADPARVHQVIGNLLQNCARHCRDGDTVTVSASSTPDAPARLTVADTGPGIPEADLPHVFTRFWRSGTSSGSGLGMPIVMSLVEAHGGSVAITSDGRTGTTVTVDLPPAPPGPHAAPVRGDAEERSPARSPAAGPP